MGWQVLSNEANRRGFLVQIPGEIFGELPEYSIDMAEAWEIIEKLRERNQYVQCTDLSLDSGEEWWSWHFHDHASISGEYVSATASTAPIAICLAALKTVGVEVELKIENG